MDSLKVIVTILFFLGAVFIFDSKEVFAGDPEGDIKMLARRSSVLDEHYYWDDLFYDVDDCVVASRGDIINCRVECWNKETKDLTNVDFRAVFPRGVSLVKDSTKFYNNRYEEGTILSDVINKKGINFRSFKEGGHIYIGYQVKIDDDFQGDDITGQIFMESDQGKISDEITIIVRSGLVFGVRPLLIIIGCLVVALEIIFITLRK